MIMILIKYKTVVITLTFILLMITISGYGLTNNQIQQYQSILQNKPIGERINFWAEKFINTPYDIDPKGIYVTRKTIVNDGAVDCMYLMFRVIELALSNSPEEAINVALDKRFLTHGKLNNGVVVNYEDRFQYGEDMIESGKWGTEVTAALGSTIKISGSREKQFWIILPTEQLIQNLQKLKTGDLIFFVKDPNKRIVGEEIGHLGIIEVKPHQVFLIQAHGTKQHGGKVIKIPLTDYLKTMPFVGVRISRLS
jgi:hypothetical protein